MEGDLLVAWRADTNLTKPLMRMSKSILLACDLFLRGVRGDSGE